MLYGPNGELMFEEGNTETSMYNGWRPGLPWDGGNASRHIYGVSREQQRRQTRWAFFNNPLFGSAVEIAAALLIGDEFSYGEPNVDKVAAGALAEFWELNDLGHLVATRLTTEYLLDGELCAVFAPKDRDYTPDAASPVVHLDMDAGVELKWEITGPTSVSAPDGAGGRHTWHRGEFVFTAHGAMWNDPRGWPVSMRAVAPAQGYLTLLQHRLNTHDLQGRILGVQTVFVDREDPNAMALYREKASAYRRMPKKGGMLTLAKTVTKDGKMVSDEVQFMTPAAGAANAEADARAFMRLTALGILGMPEHYLGEGGNANRATAAEMNLPSIRSVKRIHGALRRHLDQMYRLDLRRRYGDRLYTVTTYDVRDGGKTRVAKKKRVTAAGIEVPWVFPQITQDSLADLLARAEASARNGWASPQTLSGSLGWDPAEEDDRMAAVGLTFGQPDTRAAQPMTQPGGGPRDPASDPNE